MKRVWAMRGVMALSILCGFTVLIWLIGKIEHTDNLTMLGFALAAIAGFLIPYFGLVALIKRVWKP